MNGNEKAPSASNTWGFGKQRRNYLGNKRHG